MTKKNFIGSMLALALAMQTGVPYVLAADDISVTKSGDFVTVTGTESITVFDSEEHDVTSSCEINKSGGEVTVDISGLEKGSEKYYIKAGGEFYSFMNTFPEFNDDFTTDKGWVFVRPHNMTMGSATINSVIPLDPVNNDNVMKNVSAGREGLFIPSQNYRKYDAKNSTIEVIEEIVTGTKGEDYPKTSTAAQIFVNLQEIYRPSNTDYQYAEWNLSAKGYGVLVTWNNVIVRRYDGEYSNQYKTIQGSVTGNDINAGSAVYVGRTSESKVDAPIQAEYTKYWRKVDTRYEDAKVIIDVSIAPIGEDGKIIADLMWKGTYTDENPVSVSGSFGVSQWFFTNPDWRIYSFKFTNNNPDEVVKKDNITNIDANVAGVVKSSSSIEISFDGDVTSFSRDKINVLSASGIRQSVTKTFGDKKVSVDISKLAKDGATYSLVISTVNGDKVYNFNMPSVWTADFTKQDCGLHRYRQDYWDKGFDINGVIEGNAGVTSYNVSSFTSGGKTYNECPIDFSALHFSDSISNLTPASSGGIEFNMHMGQWGVSPAVAYISDVREPADCVYKESGDFRGNITGYLIYYYGGNVPQCVRFDNAEPSVGDHNDKKLTSSNEIEEGFIPPSGNDLTQQDKIWGVKSSIENTGNSVVITYQLTDQNGKTGTYTFIDKDPMSDKTLIGLAANMARAGGNNISELSIYYDDNTLTNVRTNKELMTEWVETRKQQTGRDSINMVTLGGSITQGAGWSDMLAEYFAKQTGTAFNLINSGIGGTGSELAAARLEKDVIEKQPDIVFLDHAVNDSSFKLLFHSGYIKTAANVEYIIRKLMTMENPPLIYMVDFTTEEILKNDLRMDANYAAAETAFKNNTLTYDFNYDNSRSKGSTVTDESDLYLFRKAYVGTPGETSQLENNAWYVKALAEDVYDYLAQYYNIPSINMHNFLKQYCSLDNVVTEDREKNANSGYVMNVDYYELQNDYKAYASNSNDKAILEEYNSLDDTKTDIQAILYDKTHSNEIGKRLYGDYMIHLFETNSDYSFKPQKYSEKTLIGEDYAAMSEIKDVELTAYRIANSAKFSTEGNLEIKDSYNGTYISDYVTITNKGTSEGSLSYKFKGRQFGVITNGTAKSITVDGKTYSAMFTMFNKLNGLEHEFEITLEPGQSIELIRMFTDEDLIPNVGTAKASDNSSVITLDITDYANAYVYRNTDGVDGDDYAWKATTPWQKSYTHYQSTEESIGYNLLSAQDIIGQLDEDNLWIPEKSASVYDMSVLKRNSYYKAIKAKSNITLSVPEINTQSVSMITLPCFNTVDDITAVLGYSDGTSETVTFAPSDDKVITTLKVVGGNGNTNSNRASLYEIIVNADASKKLSTIKLDNGVINMLILGISLKPSAENSDKIATYYEVISDEHGNIIASDTNGNYDLSAYKGKTLSYTADVLNLDTVNGNYTIYLALYNGGKLVNVVSSDCAVDEKGRINAEITIPNDNNQYSLKAFVWNADKEMAPMKATRVWGK